MRLQQSSSKIFLSKYFICQQLNGGSKYIHISSDEENGCQQMAYYELSYQDITIFIFVLACSRNTKRLTK